MLGMSISSTASITASPFLKVKVEFNNPQIEIMADSSSITLLLPHLKVIKGKGGGKRTKRKEKGETETRKEKGETRKEKGKKERKWEKGKKEKKKLKKKDEKGK